MARPKGSKNKDGYTMSAKAYHQRVMAPMKHGENSALYQAIIERKDLSPEHKEILANEKIRIWKKFDTPAVMLMDEYAQFKTMMNVKMLEGEDPTSKDMRECMKLLLDISKEINRLTHVSADKKMEIFGKSFSRSNEIEIEIKGETKDEPTNNGKAKGISEEVQEDSIAITNVQDNSN